MHSLKLGWVWTRAGGCVRLGLLGYVWCGERVGMAAVAYPAPFFSSQGSPPLSSTCWRACGLGLASILLVISPRNPAEPGAAGKGLRSVLLRLAPVRRGLGPVRQFIWMQGQLGFGPLYCQLLSR